MTDEQYMREAVAQAYANVEAGGQPFGAVLVRNGEILASTSNKTHITHDPTAHAEIQAIREASAKLGSPDMTGAVMYASGQPCSMCYAAMARCGIRTVFVAYSDADGEPFDFSTVASYEEIARAPEARALQLRALKPAGEQGLYEAWQARQS